MREEETAGAGSGGAEAQQEGRARGQDGREARRDRRGLTSRRKG